MDKHRTVFARGFSLQCCYFVLLLKGRGTKLITDREYGQSSVEAALMVPVLLACILLLVQPCIVLYDRSVMQSAAGEACRLLSTLDEDQQEMVKDFVMRRLAAIPQQDNFHVHADSLCSYHIETQGCQSSNEVSVKISNKLKPLPLIDFVCQVMGSSGDDGCLTVEVQASEKTQPEWISTVSAGVNPSEWVGAWQ